MGRNTSWENTLQGQRQIAVHRLMAREDFLTVASDNKISPRTLLAWREHEYAKWAGDSSEGREPGPSYDYDGEWPNEQEEMEAYAGMGLDPARFPDENLRKRYAKFFQEWNAELVVRNQEWTRREKQKEEMISLLRQRKLNHEEISHKVGVSVAKVNRHVVNLLVERAVLTRAVCREVRDGKVGPNYVRASFALNLLERWLAENMGYSYPSSNQDEITNAPRGCKELMQEIHDGESVCRALDLQGTADRQSEAQSDVEGLREALDNYWRKHRRPVP
jgi:predicted transcriptional regulator